MAVYIQVSDPHSPATCPWWMALLRHGDMASVLHFHDVITRQLRLRDGADPHNASDRNRSKKEGTLTLADLREPTILSSLWLATAIDLVQRGDALMSVGGGLQPRDGSLRELAEVEAQDWPPAFRADRRITIESWGKHYYLDRRTMIFAEKYNSEADAMEVAQRFAPVENISIKRLPQNFSEGD